MSNASLPQRKGPSGPKAPPPSGGALLQAGEQHTLINNVTQDFLPFVLHTMSTTTWGPF